VPAIWWTTSSEASMDTILAPDLGDVIKVGSDCYERMELTAGDPDITDAAAYSTCDECADGSATPSDAPSSAPSSAAPSSAASSGEESSSDPCESVNCSGDPSMKISVSNMGATEMISWCGETWNLPDENGMTKCVCGAYGLNQDPGTPMLPHPSLLHQWAAGAPGTSLDLYRRFFQSIDTLQFYPSQYDVYRQRQHLRVHGDDDVQWGSVYYGAQYTTILANDIGKITGEGKPTVNDYGFGAAWFGSHTDGGGVTYSWEKGNDWP